MASLSSSFKEHVTQARWTVKSWENFSRHKEWEEGGLITRIGSFFKGTHEYYLEILEAFEREAALPILQDEKKLTYLNDNAARVYLALSDQTDRDWNREREKKAEKIFKRIVALIQEKQKPESRQVRRDQLIVEAIARFEKREAREKGDKRKKLRGKIRQLKAIKNGELELEEPPIVFKSKREKLLDLDKTPDFVHETDIVQGVRRVLVDNIFHAILSYEKEDRLNACAIHLAKGKLKINEKKALLHWLILLDEKSHAEGKTKVGYSRIKRRLDRIIDYELLDIEGQKEMDQFLIDANKRIDPARLKEIQQSRFKMKRTQKTVD